MKVNLCSNRYLFHHRKMTVTMIRTLLIITNDVISYDGISDLVASVSPSQLQLAFLFKLYLAFIL